MNSLNLDPKRFWQTIKKLGYKNFAGVPDSSFGNAYQFMIDDPEIKYIPAIREDVAIGIASASHISNSKGGIILQNSGLGNLVNPLTSFNLIYKIPVLMIIGWRGYGGRSNDAPEHWIMGEETTNVLDIFGIPWRSFENNNYEIIEELTEKIDELSIPGALIIPPGSFI